MESGARQPAACSELLKDARPKLLCTACHAEVSPRPGSLYVEPAGSRRSMEEGMQAYLDTLSGKPFEPLACCSDDNIQSLIEEMQRCEQEDRRKSENMEELKVLSIMELEKLEGELLCKLSSVHYMKETLLEKTWQYIVKKLELILGRTTTSLGCKVNELESTCSSYNGGDP